MTESGLESPSFQKKRIFLFFFSVTLLLLAFVFISLTFGNVSIPLKEIFLSLFSPGQSQLQNENIILKIRLPRMCMAFILGGALSLSGFLLQTYFQNPIAGPFVLGISSGAKMTVAMTMIFLFKNGFHSSSLILITAAFAGALISTFFILLVSMRVHHIASLLVSGIMIGYITSAITDFFITFAEDADIANLHNWSRGSFAGFDLGDCGVSALLVFLTFALLLFLAKPIGAYQMGETYARTMGVNTRLFRPVLILLSSLLSACVTAFAGPVSFVGIAVPFLVKQLLKTSRPLIIIPASFLGGSLFCLVCDFIARTVLSPMELSISTVTSCFGAPVVIFMLLKKNR